MNRLIASLTLAFLAGFSAIAQVTVSLTETYGIRPNRGDNAAPKFAKALADLNKRYPDSALVLTLAPGRYDFHPAKSSVREYFISNHDQDNPKNVGIAIENRSNLTLEATGADFVFHGRMLPIAVVGSENCTLRGFSIDFERPHITQVEILGNDSRGITFRVSPESEVFIDKKGGLSARGEGWTIAPRSGIAFNPATHRLLYQTSDLNCRVDSVIALDEKATFLAPKWQDSRLTEGTIVALRGWNRPAPGIFLSESTNTTLQDINIHYAEGMGVLAQLCDNITLDGLNVCLRKDSPRYFTTQADATHFSGCKGLIKSSDGLYEGMMDDAINVHGTYLKVTDIIDSHTLSARYMHPQTYGFKWGEAGDSVKIIRAETMEAMPDDLLIESITTADHITFDIRFTTELPANIDAATKLGLENLTWTPRVIFDHNTIRNNRARGSLFSTPRKTIVEDNLFDHTSGTAILLCGDCMGWYETGACHDVTIRRNTFINALTNMFQFTNAVISIYPEIHNLQQQQAYFHSGVTIEDNLFKTFDAPLLYAKSTDGIIFRNNTVVATTDYPPFHPNKFNFRFQRCKNVTISDNTLPQSPSIKFE